MIRKLKSGEYRIYSIKVDPRTGKGAIWVRSRRAKRPRSTSGKSSSSSAGTDAGRLIHSQPHHASAQSASQFGRPRALVAAGHGPQQRAGSGTRRVSPGRPARDCPVAQAFGGTQPSPEDDAFPFSHGHAQLFHQPRRPSADGGAAGPAGGGQGRTARLVRPAAPALIQAFGPVNADRGRRGRRTGSRCGRRRASGRLAVPRLTNRPHRA